jgi:hypothetical protein
VPQSIGLYLAAHGCKTYLNLNLNLDLLRQRNDVTRLPTVRSLGRRSGPRNRSSGAVSCLTERPPRPDYVEDGPQANDTLPRAAQRASAALRAKWHGRAAGRNREPLGNRLTPAIAHRGTLV